MNKKPVLGRLIFVIILLLIFGWSIYPLHQRNFYSVLESVTKKSSAVEQVVKLAQEKEKKDSNLYPSMAVEQAANQLNVDLAEYCTIPNVMTNRDVVQAVRTRCASSIKLGLDLNGGTEFDVTVVRNTPTTQAEKQEAQAVTISTLRDRVMDILRNRINQSGLVEPEIAAEGADRIAIKIPVSSPAQKNEYKKLIEMSASLEFRLVAQNNSQLVAEYEANPSNFVPPIGYQRMQMVTSNRFGKSSIETVFVEVHPLMSGENITNAQVVTDQYGRRQISLNFNTTGAEQFGDVTSKNIGRRLAIVLDGTLYSAPVVQSAIYGGQASITGDFSQEEAQNVATALACGNLPAKVMIDSIFDTAPTLGKATVRSGTIAGIIALLGVGLFMLIYYMKAGLVADIALICNVIFIMGALASFGATLTLPGIAGIILTIGMAVDANVLIYERIREEIDSGKTLISAIDIGYKRAFATIFDSNITTLIVGLILYWAGTGPVKGFGVTLSIGIVASMFSAIFITRLIFDIYARFFHIKSLKMFKLLSNTKIHFLKLWKYCIFISLGLIIASCIVAAVKISHGNILSVDFTGGTQLILNCQKPPAQTLIENTLNTAGYSANVSYKYSPTEGYKAEITLHGKSKITTGSGEMPVIVNILNQHFANAHFTGAQESTIGGLVGSQFALSAILAIILSFICMIIYISLRFEPTYAIAAIIALIHDVIIGTGVLLFCDRQISLTVIAAILTVVGYSVNDTIIVFDRVRENLRFRKDLKYRDIIDLSINQTLSRTIITSLLTFIVVLVLFIFGGVSINSFALVMMAGIIVGTYSSIFVASPLVAHWHKKRIGIKE